MTTVPAEPDRPRWPELHPGEKVRLEVDATAGYPLGDDMTVFYVAHVDKTVSLYLPVDHPQVRVTRAEPADGVPQVGELWTDRTGRAYFAIGPWQGDKPADPRFAAVGGASLLWREVHTGSDGPIRRLMTAEQIASWR